MGRQIAIIQGNPDPDGGHYGHALADAYSAAAQCHGHAVRTIAVAAMDFPWLRTEADFNSGALAPAIREAQQVLTWANHLVIIFPLWHGTMPALLKAFLEQTFRPGFAMEYAAPGRPPRRLLKHKSARIVTTMGMPAWLYRWLFHAHGVRGLERSILWWAGISPIGTTLIGNVGERNLARHQRWLERMQQLGARAA